MLAMGSCVSTDSIDTSTDLTLSLDIFGANIPGSALAESDSVGIYFGDDYKNVEYKLSGDGVLTPVDQAIVLDTSAPQMLAAYYPYDANRTSSEYAVDITDQESIETMYWTSATSSSSKYDLKFSSLYSKLNIVASNLNSRTDMTCTLVGATAVGSFDLATGEVSTTSEDGAVFSLENVSNVAELTLNVVPCADLLNVGLKFESSSDSYSYTYYPFVKSSEWVSGDVYSYNLTLPTTNIEVTGVTLSEKTLTIKETFPDILVATLTPTNATNTSIIWSTSDNNIAHIENGVVTGVNSGVATITATSVDGKYSDTCVVTVDKYEPTIATKVDLNYGTAKTFELGRRVTFTATLTPEETTDKRVEYDSSNTDVAIIDDDGVMSVLSEGKTVITVTSISDRSVTNSCEVTVSGGEVLKIGDYIYSTGDYLYSSTYTSSNVMLGIVYKVNDDKKSG